MDDPFRPSLAKFAKLGHTFLIPWTSEPITIMAGFESARLQSIEGPLVLESPFDMTDVKLVTMLHELSGSSNSYDDAFSSRTEQNSEHMSMAGALSVGCPILKGEVSGKYSKTIKESKDNLRISRQGSYRIGRLVLKHAPPLSPRAIQTLKNGRMDSETRIWIDGPAYFRELYGDFFVSGFVLGADAGASVSADTRASTVEEASELTVKVKFLFLEAERKEKSTSQVSSLSASMNFCGYSTLEKKTVAAGKDSSQASEQQIRELASSFMPKIHGLQKEVGERVIDLGLTDGGTIALTAATRICHSNLVVQLILSPFARLEEYVHHASRSISTDF